MTDIGAWAFRNRKLVYFLVFALVAGGAWSCWRMSKLEDPEIKVKLAMVVTTYPGASAHRVELEVTDVLEKSIRQMEGVYSVESWSQSDVSLIMVELESTVPDKDVEQHWDMLRRRVGDARASLPGGAGEPAVRDDFGNVFGMFYALTGDGQTERELCDYAELLRREVSDMEGVEKAVLYGERKECINITMLEDRMATLGVKPAEVLATLNQQNSTAYTGYIDNGDRRVRVAVDDQFRTVGDIEGMLIQGHSDDQLRLGDIARVERGYEEPVRAQLFRDGERAIGLLIAPSHGTDIVKVGRAVERRLERLVAERLPAGVECHKVFFQPDRVSRSLGSFAVNLAESVGIVILILMLAMGLRSGLVIGISLLVTVFGSFLFLQGFDGTMQRVSLGAFVLAMGMLVDNAIVVIDGILVDLKAGKSRREAMTGIGRRTAMPLLGATLIAIVAFLPIFLSPDTAGVYTRDLFVVLAVSLLLSWALALAHVPLLANRLLPKGAAEATESPAYEGRTYRTLRRVLLFGLRHRWSCVLVAVALLLLSGIGFGYMKQGFFPDMVYDQLYVEYKLPEGNNYTRVERDLREIGTYLCGREEVRHVTASTGGTPGRYNLVRSIANPSLSYGELIVDFASPKALERNIDEIQDYLTAHYPDAYVKAKRYNLMFKKYPIEAQFSGPDPAVLHSLADSAMAIMRRAPEVCLVTTDWEPRVPMLTVEYDQPAARTLGLGRTDVSLSLLAVAGGIPIGEFREGTHREGIYLRSLGGTGDISGTQVFSALPSAGGLLTKETFARLLGGTFSRDDIVESLMGSTPLRQVSHGVRVDWEDPVVPRCDGQRSQRAQCSPSPGVETERARLAIAKAVESLPLPEGYTMRWQGERAASTRSMEYLFRGFPLAVILMVAILIMLFGDYRKPLVIILCLPVLMVGVVVAMLLTGKVFNFVAIVGTLGLMGMLVKNGIVLMDELTLQLSCGADPVEALVGSAQSRLRPVVMASLTTILGMLPLLTDAMFGSLAASVMGGLLVGTLITLLLLPILYALFFNIKATRQ